MGRLAPCLQSGRERSRSDSSNFIIFQEDDPPGSLDALSVLLLKLFPNCDNLVQKGNGKLRPHVSLAKCKSERRARELIPQLSARLGVVEFPVNEVLLLVRDSEYGRGHPFRLHASVLLGSAAPSFGPGSVEWASCSQVVISGHAKALEEAKKLGRRVEMLKNRSSPSVALVWFDDLNQAATFVSDIGSPQVELRRLIMYP